MFLGGASSFIHADSVNSLCYSFPPTKEGTEYQIFLTSVNIINKWQDSENITQI